MTFHVERPRWPRDPRARLGLADTWWETLEPAPPGEPARAHQLAGEHFDNAVLDASVS